MPMKMNHLIPIFLLTNLLIAEPSTESLNQLQKQVVESAEVNQQAQRDLDALDLLQGKLKNRAWILSRYPNGQELGAGIKPRLEIRQARATGVTAYVPTRYVRGKILPGSSQCSATAEYQVDVSACSDVNKITSCVAGKKTIVGTACTPSGQRGSSDYTVDNSQLGSLEIMSQADLEQSGFLGVGALGLISASEASSHFTNASGVLNSQAVASVPIQFIKYRTDAIYPLLVSGLEVRVGNTLALVPLEAPVPATCYISAVDQVSGGQSVGFTMHGTGVISSAELNGGSISLPLQSSDPGTRVLSTLSLVAPSSPGQLTNLVQEANSDYANGQWTISGRVVGPKNDGNFTCSKVVQVRVYNPKAPECGLAISPD
ncbi:hypothetical protein EBR78_09250, partial [bacterium]|nr:hypothetical protein [bacterium]